MYQRHTKTFHKPTKNIQKTYQNLPRSYQDHAVNIYIYQQVLLSMQFAISPYASLYNSIKYYCVCYIYIYMYKHTHTYTRVVQNNWNSADYTPIFQWPINYIKNIDKNFSMGVYIHCRWVYLFSWLYICNFFLILLKFKLKCVTQLSLKNGELLELVWQEPELGFPRTTISRTMMEFK